MIWDNNSNSPMSEMLCKLKTSDSLGIMPNVHRRETMTARGQWMGGGAGKIWPGGKSIPDFVGKGLRGSLV